MKATLLTVFSLLLLFAAGCAHTPGGIAASTIPIDGREYMILGPAKATSTAVYLFNFIPVSGSSSLRDAKNAAIRSKGADALIDVTAESYSQFWIIFSKSTIMVEGTAIRFTDGGRAGGSQRPASRPSGRAPAERQREPANPDESMDW
ncbi:MAG: hypothetical protein AB7V22_04285 [Kiritimatiellia bacterium]